MAADELGDREGTVAARRATVDDNQINPSHVFSFLPCLAALHV
jgi:hypothetical protein